MFGYNFFKPTVCGNATARTIATLLLPLLDYLQLSWAVEQPVLLSRVVLFSAVCDLGVHWMPGQIHAMGFSFDSSLL